MKTASERTEMVAWAERIIVALDTPDLREVERLCDELEGVPCWMKVGMELFYAVGPNAVELLKKRGHRVFVDLKLHDIPNTVRGGIVSLVRCGADMLNVHASGGVRMMEAAREAVERAAGSAPSAIRPLLVAVTVLTSLDRDAVNRELGIPGAVEETAVRFANMAREAGLDGVVASAAEVRAVKEACGRSFLTVVPGIRPAGVAPDDQARRASPEEAAAAGADYLVIGRPITHAPDPRRALETVLASLAAAVPIRSEEESKS